MWTPLTLPWDRHWITFDGSTFSWKNFCSLFNFYFLIMNSLSVKFWSNSILAFWSEREENNYLYRYTCKLQDRSSSNRKYPAMKQRHFFSEHLRVCIGGLWTDRSSAILICHSRDEKSYRFTSSVRVHEIVDGKKTESRYPREIEKYPR